MKKRFKYGVACILLAAGAVASDVVTVSAAPADGSGRAMTRRITSDQYANVIAEVFGPSIQLSGRFEPDPRVDGLVEVGAGRVSVSVDGMAEYDSMARGIAAQVVSEANRKDLIPCTPANPKAADAACAGQFLSQTGRLLFRRPMTETEQKHYVEAAGAAAKTLGDFYQGLSLSLGAMLASPQFLFRAEKLEPDPNNPGRFRLDGYSKASRLSFFLWNSVPDDSLLTAAQNGELHSSEGLTRQVTRMLASPRLDVGVRAFFSDMFAFDGMTSLVKDATLYPSFDTIVVQNAQEQTLRTVVDHVVHQRGDYRDIFTTRKTFMTQALASIYNVPLVNDVANGGADTWQRYEFPANDPRAGVLTHISFTALHSHPGRSSATLRGKAVREIMFCQKVPAPPGAVDFTLIQDIGNPKYRTARDRLNAHATDPVCAGCHKITDPMGLALENFDGDGSFRKTENGALIDARGELSGKKFEDSAGLGAAVRNDPAAPSCLVDRMLAYGLGRSTVAGEAAWKSGLKAEFAKDGYVVPELMRKIVLSPEFFSAAPPVPANIKEARNVGLEQSRKTESQ
ncbi:MAG: DUF1592 domain-containing protein [Rhodospirillaceae bacterium]